MKSASPLVYLGLGAAIATGALFLMSQAVPPTSHSSSSAIPRKNVVNLFEKFAAPVVLAPGQEVVFYTVPSDRWLTVTACDMQSSYAPSTLFWGENNNGAFTRKGEAWSSGVWDFGGVGSGSPAIGGFAHGLPYSPLGGGDAGWVFRPGSQLVVKNTGTAQQQFTRYSVLGYLSRD